VAGLVGWDCYERETLSKLTDCMWRCAISTYITQTTLLFMHHSRNGDTVLGTRTAENTPDDENTTKTRYSIMG
jgi:hypothetical protein